MGKTQRYKPICHKRRISKSMKRWYIMKKNELNLVSVSECEELVLAVLFDFPEPPALEAIMNEVNQRNKKTWKPQTVSTFLFRLREKGYLEMFRKGRYCYYTLNITKDEYVKKKFIRDCAVFYDGNYNEISRIIDTLAIK